ncbi:Glutaredoxin domain-containing protein [Psidium guajava]|nr:Glutaredoxin domain-containing protein [Psidium guajava]
MKGVKGKLLKKLQTIKPIGHLKQDRILHLNAADGYVETFLKNPIMKAQTMLFPKGNPDRSQNNQGSIREAQEPEVIDVTELMKDLEDAEMGFDDDLENKENIGPNVNAESAFLGKENCENMVTKSELESSPDEASRLSETEELPRNSLKTPLSEIDVSNFRRPDLNSSSLFDPNLLAAFEQAVKEQIRISQEVTRTRIEAEPDDLGKSSDEPPSKTRRIEEDNEDADPLFAFEEKCPPGGCDSVIFYTTSLRGIRKTFEDCGKIRFLLSSFRILYYERDVSMHTEFKEELWDILGGKTVPPRVFIKGRYIGGAEQVLGLHEQGKLNKLLEGVPIDRSTGPCEGCGGMKFVMCFKCNGSHKLMGEDSSATKCLECNENGLIICPLCC